MTRAGRSVGWRREAGLLTRFIPLYCSRPSFLLIWANSTDCVKRLRRIWRTTAACAQPQDARTMAIECCSFKERPLISCLTACSKGIF